MNKITNGIQSWNQATLAAGLLDDLDRESPTLGRWVNGRIVGLLASPFDASATDFAFGVSVLKPGTATPRHSHRAEELAIILHGAGTIEIGEDAVVVTEGDVVLNPPDIPHRTTASEHSAIAVLWIYSQADSALRWLHDAPEESA